MIIVENFKSIDVRKIGYEVDQSLLQIWFHSGTTYQYFDVPPAVWKNFCAAESKGKYVHASIIGKFRHIKV